MMDKVQKIRKEVARIQLYSQSEVLKDILAYIDKVQEEPKFKTGDRIKPIDSCLGSPRTIVDVCNSWYVTDQGTLDFEYEDNWEAIEEPVSEELEKVSDKYSEDIESNYSNDMFDRGDIMKAFKAGANWQKEKDSTVSEDLEKIVEEIAEPTILNAYGTKELARRLRNTICGTSISENLEKASKEWLSPQLDKSYAAYGETKQMELTHFDGYAMLDAIEFGAQWQKTKDEATTEDLGEYINKLSKQFPEVSFAKLSRVAVRVAKWQKQQDQSTIELAEDHAYFAGRTKTIDEIKESLLSEVLPCFMHGGEADEVVAKLDEVLNFQKK